MTIALSEMESHGTNSSLRSKTLPVTPPKSRRVHLPRRDTVSRNSSSPFSKMMTTDDRTAAKCKVIGPLADTLNCKADERETIGDTHVVVHPRAYDSLFHDDGSDTESSHSTDDLDEQDSMMPGVLADGIPYTVTQDLVQGWVHKKGTGMDWIGSRAWKPRWAVLSLARMSGYEVEVPLLQIFWHYTSPTPSTVIHLDSAVVVPQDHSDDTKWNAFRFQIRHVKRSADEDSIQATRLFSCPRSGRDSWCQAINQALLEYEKEKAEGRKHSAYVSLSPPRWRSKVAWATGDAHPSKAQEYGLTTPTPPSSPRSPFSQPLNLPRHEPHIIGEAFLALSIEN